MNNFAYLSTDAPPNPSFGIQRGRYRHFLDLTRHATGQFRFIELGHSEQGYPLFAVEVGTGDQLASLLAGSHADEPVGSETLTCLLDRIARDPVSHKRLLDEWTLHILPHINPDGELANQAWISTWPDLGAYIRHAIRELPGRDMEFGYPEMRLENRLVSAYLAERGPFDLHMSLHGMGFGEGVLLLIEREWAKRTEVLQQRFTQRIVDVGLRLHDHDRMGEKGFEYLGPGYTSTPRGRAMQDHFLERNEPETAALFYLSSMEYIRSLGGDTLSLVTEVPLYLITDGPKPSTPGTPARFLALRERLTSSARAVCTDDWIAETKHTFGLQHVPLATQISLQLEAILLGLQTTSVGA